MTEMTPEEIERLRKLGRKAREERFIELGRRGANANTKHPDRKEWEMLRDLHEKWANTGRAAT